MKKIIITIIAFVFFYQTAYCADEPYAVENLMSTTHTIEVPSSYTQIKITWSEPSAFTPLDGYFITFDENNDLNFEFNTDNITGIPVNTTEDIFNCSGDDDYFYFHIAPAYYDYTTSFDYVIGTTINQGPYRIDTTPPYNLTIEAPQYVSSNPIDLTVGVIGASKMCISNIDFNTCQEDWPDLKEFIQWNLPVEDGSHTIFFQCKDEAGNIASTAVNTYFDTIPPEAKMSIFRTDDPFVFLLSIIFSEPIKNFDISDITVSNGEANDLIAEELNPYTYYTVNIIPEYEGIVTVRLPVNTLSDRSGNGNIQAEFAFRFGAKGVPTLNEWGIILFITIILMSGLKMLKINNFKALL